MRLPKELKEDDLYKDDQTLRMEVAKEKKSRVGHDDRPGALTKVEVFGHLGYAHYSATPRK